MRRFKVRVRFCTNASFKDLEHSNCNGLWRRPLKVLSGESYILLHLRVDTDDFRSGKENQDPRWVFCYSVRHHINVRPTGKRLSSSISMDSWEGRFSSKDDSQSRNVSSGTDGMDICRVSSPDSYVPPCSFNCPMTPPENQAMACVVRFSLTDVFWYNLKSMSPKVSLSACKDDELAYDDNVTGETVTKVGHNLLSIFSLTDVRLVLHRVPR